MLYGLSPFGVRRPADVTPPPTVVADATRVPAAVPEAAGVSGAPPAPAPPAAATASGAAAPPEMTGVAGTPPVPAAPATATPPGSAAPLAAAGVSGALPAPGAAAPPGATLPPAPPTAAARTGTPPVTAPTQAAPPPADPQAQVAAIVSPPIPPRLTRTELQARLAGLIAGLRCALVHGRMEGQDRASLAGIAGAGAEALIRADVLAADLPVTIAWGVASASREFCPVLDMLRPVTPAFGTAGPPLVLKLAEDKVALRDGEAIRPRLIMPPYNAYLYVDYIAHDGNVQHLYPQVTDPANGIAGDAVRVFAPSEWVNLGDPQPGQRGWEASAPYGTDMIIAIAASRPLFDGPRPANAEPAWDYLRALGRAIQALKQDSLAVTANAILVEVSPR
jgi:serine/threonine-protein kinase